MNTVHGAAIAVQCPLMPGAPRRQEITFADGSALWLHRIASGSAEAVTYERELQWKGQPVQVDLRQFAPDLAFRIDSQTTARDTSSAVFTSLRARFKSTDELLAQLGAMQ